MSILECQNKIPQEKNQFFSMSLIWKFRQEKNDDAMLQNTVLTIYLHCRLPVHREP